MPLPVARDRTYATTDKLNRSHLNNWQDVLRAIWRGRRGARWLQVHAVDAWNQTGWSFGTAVYNCDTPTSVLVCPIVLPVGTRLRQVIAHINRAAAGSVSADLRKLLASDGSSTSLGSTTPGGGGWTAASVIAALHTVAAGSLYVVAITGTAVNDQFAGLELEVDNP